MRNPKISIVMPSYNQADFIEEAIESVLQQSYRNFELIIVDGLSKDGTAEKILQYQGHPNVSKIVIEKDKGQVDALCKGFNYCTGEIYTWLNSDDSFAPGAFQKVADNFEENNSIDVLNGELDVINEHSKFIARWPRKKISNKRWLHSPQPIGQPSTFFKSEIFKKVGGIEPTYEYSMDYDLFFKFALADAKFQFIDDSLACFRVHAKSKTMALPFKQWKEEIKVFYKLSNKKILSGFYYWKFRGIAGTVIRQYLLRSRKF